MVSIWSSIAAPVLPRQFASMSYRFVGGSSAFAFASASSTADFGSWVSFALRLSAPSNRCVGQLCEGGPLPASVPSLRLEPKTSVCSSVSSTWLNAAANAEKFTFLRDGSVGSILALMASIRSCTSALVTLIDSRPSPSRTSISSMKPCGVEVSNMEGGVEAAQEVEQRRCGGA
eukprot:1365174-Prymnesium_polylepis.1